jgi:hypothetical protein
MSLPPRWQLMLWAATPAVCCICSEFAQVETRRGRFGEVSGPKLSSRHCLVAARAFI